MTDSAAVCCRVCIDNRENGFDFLPHPAEDDGMGDWVVGLIVTASTLLFHENDVVKPDLPNKRVTCEVCLKQRDCAAFILQKQHQKPQARQHSIPTTASLTNHTG
jgi:hypothetical protein